MRAASALGLRVRDRMPEIGIDLVVYGDGEKQISVLEGRYDDQLRARDFLLTEDKYAAKLLLQEAGFTTPVGFSFTFDDDEEEEEEAGEERSERALRFATEAFGKLGRIPVVAKPRAGMRGNGVRMDLGTPEAAAAHMTAWRHHFRDWLLEEQIEGPDLRIQLVDGELVAACVRKPAFVTADGRSSVGALIEARRNAIKEINPSSELAVDAETEELLAEQGLAPADVPETGRAVRLKRAANMAKGGVAVDVTDSLHPDFSDWAASAARLFDTKILAIDAVCAAPGEPPEGNATVLEVNAAPEWLHHTFSEQRTHDIATRILRSWFAV